MAARKTERLMNLVICLLATPRYLTAAHIRDAVPGYAEQSDEAFKRMFERDKEELRELGIPLELGTNSVWDEEPGYRIARRDYELPAIALTAEEAAAVGLAARLWRSASFADATSRALVKLRAAGIEVDGAATTGFEPRVEATEPALEPLLDAVREGRSVRFTHRPTHGAETVRHVDPWGVVSWHGRWYVVGHDRDRRATRSFRLSRITGTVEPAGPAEVPAPAEVDLRGVVAAFATEPPAKATARLRVRAGRAWSLRRDAEAAVPSASHAGWDELTVAYHHEGAFAALLCGHGADVIVLEPPELRAAVVARLRTLVGAR